MNIRLIYLLTFTLSSSLYGMDTKIPPAKEGANALVNFVMKKCGLSEINTDETQKVIAAFAEITLSPKSNIHELVKNNEFIILAKRAAEKEYLLHLSLLDAMQNNKPETIRQLLERCETSTSVKTVAKEYLDEETEANEKIIDAKRKK